MTDFEQYQIFLNNIFGENVIQIKQTSNSNNIIGTFKYENDFNMFKDNFSLRLTRLKEIYKGTNYFNELKKKFN